MKRGFAVIILILIMALVSCAGGSKNTLPNPNPNGQAQDDINNNDIKSPDLPLTPAEAAKRMPSSGYVENEVLVKTSLDKDRLNALVSKYGYSVDSKHGNYARVNVPDGDLPKAIAQLNREQAIFTTTVNGEFRVPTEAIPLANLKDYKARVASFAPQDALFGDTYPEPGWATDPTDPANDQRYFLGSKMFLDMASIPGAWDLNFGAGSTIAVIDGGMLVLGDTYDTLYIHAEMMDADGTNLVLQRLSHLSARVNGSGNATNIDTDADVITNVIDSTIYRTPADFILGITSSNIDFNIIYGLDAPGADGDPDEGTFTTSLPGVAPAADYMMVATGTIDTGAETPEWVYTAAEIAASIDYAVDNGADVIISGIWAPIGDFLPADVQIVQDAVDYARANDVIIVAPVGQDLRTPTEADPGPFPYYDEGDPLAVPPIPPSFTYSANFTAADFLPAGLPGVISVGASGVSTLNVDFSIFTFGAPFRESPRQIAGYNATGANIYAPGFALTTFYYAPNAENSLNWYAWDVGTPYSAAYVGGTLALIYSALRNADPAIVDIDEEAATILLHGNSAATNQLLTAAGNVALANNGGYDLILPALAVSSDLPVSSNAVTTNTAFSLEPTIQGGTGTGYQILIDWGDGTTYPADGLFEDWTPATIYDKAGGLGYTQPGTYGLTVYARDDDDNGVSGSAYLVVSNPLGATPFATETVGGAPIQPGTPGGPIPLTISTNYIFYAGPINLLGLGSEAYAWDFGDGTPVNEQNPLRTFAITGDQTVTLSIDDGIRPIYSTGFDVAVAP